MSPRKYLPPSRKTEPSPIPNGMPFDQPIAVYYRQSSMSQVGNISTSMQQIDLPKYIHSLGWSPEGIILIDEDEGVSGAKRIDERKGMRRLYDLIITDRIGAVAVQAEDRLFRDETQIQVNVFIDACVKHSVRVLTPYFKYNFADKYEGSYHRLLFRMRAEQAADFLNSYVRGRLLAAKERMLLQGLWMGGNINLGFIVDDRKTLPNGAPNPLWRKYAPFPPCSDVVVKIYEIFLEMGGNVRSTLEYIFENGPYFPDFNDPEFMRGVPAGFLCEKPLRMLKRKNAFIPGKEAVLNMLTNATYIGHWVYKGRIVQWNNHPPIVTEDLFYKAFNYLSPYNLDGQPNENYRPRVTRRLKEREPERDHYTPFLDGLVFTYFENKWRNATVTWSPGMRAYAYACHYFDEATIQQYLWGRRCDYFDRTIGEMLQAKLKATFDPSVWESVVATAGDDFEAEKRTLKHQIASVDYKMQTLLNNFTHVTSPTLLQALQQEFARYEEEKRRLEQKLEQAQNRADHQEALLKLAAQAESVLEHWDQMGAQEKRTVARVFISKIVVTPTGKKRFSDIEICWRDKSSDKFVLPYRADKYVIWSPDEVEILSELIKRKASQIEISEALPERNWRSIRIKAYEIVGKRSFQIAPKPIREGETYDDYIQRIASDKSRSHPGPRWQPEEVEKLEALLDKGAGQLEIAAALPYRSWQGLRQKITALRGREFKVPGPRPMEDNETFIEYVDRNPSAAESMAFLISKNLPPR